MNILVTGGGGYKGTVLVKKLLLNKKIKRIVVIDTFWFGNYLVKNSKLKIVKKNVLNIEKEDIKGVTHILHLAAIANDPASELNTKLTWEFACLGMKKICDLAKELKIKKFLYASSGSVYGIKKELKVTEMLSEHPISDYNKTKMICEKILFSYSAYFKIYIIRPGTVYGFSPRMRLDLSLNILTYSALKNNFIKVFGGKQIRPLIHIDDITNVYLHILFKNISPGIYNASSENISINKLALSIKKALNEYKKIKIVKYKSNDPRSYRLNCDKLKKTGFTFTKKIYQGIKEIIELYKEEKIKDNANCYTINWIKKNEK